MGRRLFLCVILFLGITSCAAQTLSPVGKGAIFQPEADEKRIWSRSAEEQIRLDDSGHIYEDPLLTAYVNEVAQKLITEDVKKQDLSFRVKIIKNPLLNAFAYPNGVLYLHTGILSKIENEAQLATILGHEMTHVVNRHTIQQFRSVKKTSATLATFQIATMPFGVFGDLATLLGAVGGMAAVTGYSRESEREADRVGLELMVKAGYDPEEAPKLFEHLKRYIEEQEIKEPFFFGSHPRLQERIDNYTSLLKSSYVGNKGIKGTEKYVEKTFKLLLCNAKLDLSMGRFSTAQRGIERFLLRESRNAKAHYYLGEVHRQRDEEGDKKKAEKEYQLASQYNPSYPEPHKGLGLIYYKQGLNKEAGVEFRRYLQLAPAAKDKSYVEQYLHEITNKVTGGLP